MARLTQCHLTFDEIHILEQMNEVVLSFGALQVWSSLEIQRNGKPLNECLYVLGLFCEQG